MPLFGAESLYTLRFKSKWLKLFVLFSLNFILFAGMSSVLLYISALSEAGVVVGASSGFLPMRISGFTSPMKGPHTGLFPAWSLAWDLTSTFCFYQALLLRSVCFIDLNQGVQIWEGFLKFLILIKFLIIPANSFHNFWAMNQQSTWCHWGLEKEAGDWVCVRCDRMRLFPMDGGNTLGSRTRLALPLSLSGFWMDETILVKGECRVDCLWLGRERKEGAGAQAGATYEHLCRGWLTHVRGGPTTLHNETNACAPWEAASQIEPKAGPCHPGKQQSM